MLKIIGMVLIVITGSGAGLAASAELSRRAASLERIERLISFLSTQIRYTAAPVKEIIAQAVSGGEFSALAFLQDAYGRMEKGERPDDAWLKAVRGGYGMCGLTMPDAELLLNFGQGLGKSDIEGQLSHCESFLQLLENRLQSARSDASAKGKLYVSLGVAGGLSVALLLL